MARSRILLVQWGRVGAGPKLAHLLAIELENLGADIYLSISSASEYRTLTLQRFGRNVLELIVRNSFSLLSPRRILRARRSFLKFVSKIDPNLIVFVMPHPWDIFIKGKSPRVRIIHDGTRHPGDSVWPTTKALSRRFSSGDQVIVLSETVGKIVAKRNSNVFASSHPIFSFGGERDRSQKVNDVLVIGRQRKYKGTKRLLEIWPLVLKEFPTATLIVAGEGRISKKLQKLPNIEIVNKWLSEEEIGLYLSTSKCVLFPYIEASQSGLLPAARSLGGQVVVTPVGGLSEQVAKFGGRVSKDMEAESIAAEICDALSNPLDRDVAEFDATSASELAILLIRLASEKGRAK